MKISIIGSGYVGLVTGVGLASKGHKIFCVDIDKEKIEKINKGESPIYEKGLDDLLKKAIKKNLFKATENLEEAILGSEVTFIAVPTPSKDNSEIDLSFIKEAAKSIGKVLALKNNYHVVVVKSTVVPETSLKVVLPLIEKYSGKKIGEFGLCMNPEFLREGSAVQDFTKPDRIVIGQIDEKSGDVVEKIYKNFKTDILRTSLNNAEIIKYTSNALLSTLISFSNEIANICERVPGADAYKVFESIYLDRRWNPLINGKRINPNILTYLKPGCGFGGSCFPKDVKALNAFSLNKKHNAKILSAVLKINKKQPIRMVQIAEKRLGNLKDKKIAVLGLSFKPDTDDTRESPAISVIDELSKRGALINVYDPVVNNENVKPPLKNLNFKFCDSIKAALKETHACLLLVDWKEFKAITPDILKKEMANPLIIDGRGFLSKKDFLGKVDYLGIGFGQS